MDSRSSAAVLAASLTIACGLEPELPDPPPADFAEICGEAEPVRVLRFEPWRRVRHAHYWTQFGERRLIMVNYEDSSVASNALWSTGLCGEAPRLLASGGLTMWSLTPYEDPFICESTSGRVRVVDPTGVRAPQAVFQLPSWFCHTVTSDAGLVNVRQDPDDFWHASLILQPWPEDVWAGVVNSVVLLDRVKFDRHEWKSYHAGGDEAFAVTGDDELVRVSVTDGAVEVIATGVRSFDISRERTGEHPRRYLLWQRMEIENDDPELPEGELLLLDRVTNERRSLGVGQLHFAYETPLRLASRGVVAVRIRVAGQPVLRLYRLPSLDYVDVDVDDSIELRHLLADDRHMVVWANERWRFLDIETGKISTLAGDPELRFWEDSRAVTLTRGEGELLLLRGDAPPERLARRATSRHLFLADGRLISAVGLDRKQMGDLIMIDPETFEERLVDRGALTSWFRLTQDQDGELLSYTILNGNDERAGLWLARLAPRD